MSEYCSILYYYPKIEDSSNNTPGVSNPSGGTINSQSI